MAENQNQKIDDLLLKVKALGSRAKEVRAQLGSPLTDRFFERVDRISQKLPAGNGNSHPQPAQPQPEVRRTCPKCGRSFNELVDFCNCGFDFQAEQRRHQREEFEREKVERGSRMGVIS